MRTKGKGRGRSQGGFELPRLVSVEKQRLGGQWVYTFRHEHLGELGRIVLQARSDGNTQTNCELAGDLAEPMFEKRAAIFKPLAMELMDKLAMATGVRPKAALEPRVVPAKPQRLVGSKHIRARSVEIAWRF